MTLVSAIIINSSKRSIYCLPDDFESQVYSTYNVSKLVFWLLFFRRNKSMFKKPNVEIFIKYESNIDQRRLIPHDIDLNYRCSSPSSDIGQYRLPAKYCCATCVDTVPLSLNIDSIDTDWHDIVQFSNNSVKFKLDTWA